MSAAKTPPIHVLRGLLRYAKSAREVDASAVVLKSSPTQDFILAQFRESKDLSESQDIQRRRKLAFDFLTLKQDIAERERLQKLDSGAEVQLSPKEMSRRAAARAGLQLPDLNPDLEK
ncbi:unnamed protein product [Cylindrotheca closterium]|uniref:Uncharacterized protein n=1 Tax=Cylindrotheca closterium TaxID=2856 RepID=A0AAD2PXC1_9STRA|nr:unnamed protein product [Cylindrotheca closterium]